MISVMPQIGCIRIAEKHKLPYEMVDELYFYKENGMEKQYKSLLKKAKQLKEQEHE